jgi:hypothetical protein
LDCAAAATASAQHSVAEPAIGTAATAEDDEWNRTSRRSTRATQFGALTWDKVGVTLTARRALALKAPSAPAASATVTGLAALGRVGTAQCRVGAGPALAAVIAADVQGAGDGDVDKGGDKQRHTARHSEHCIRLEHGMV